MDDLTEREWDVLEAVFGAAMPVDALDVRTYVDADMRDINDDLENLRSLGYLSKGDQYYRLTDAGRDKHRYI